MNLLIAIKTCHKYRDRADALRATWVKDVPVDVRFFLGRGPAGYVPRDDEVILDCGDDYDDLPAKSMATFRWALEKKYTHLCHSDDDNYLRPERLLASDFAKYDYVGRLRGPSGVWRAPYCSGFCYVLSARAMQAVVDTPANGDTVDDRFIGNALAQAGIFFREDIMVGEKVYGAGLRGWSDSRYRVVQDLGIGHNNTSTGGEGPRHGNDIIAACEFEPEDMLRIHQEFLTSKAAPRQRLAPGSLSSVCVLVKTYLRDGLLFKTIDGLRRMAGGAKIVVVDDGLSSGNKTRLYTGLQDSGHAVVLLPRDSGFGAKANAGVEVCDRPYVLIASDDFDFAPPSVRDGIEKMVRVLDAVPEIGVVSGRVNDRPYEYVLELGGDWCKARSGYSGEGLANGIRYKFTDLTVNYCLVRREVFKDATWDNDVKIGGGEHGAWFIKVKRAGWRVSYVPGVNINEIQPTKFDIHPNYLLHRYRARDKARPCYQRIGINHFVGEDGICEQCGILCTRIVLRETEESNVGRSQAD